MSFASQLYSGWFLNVYFGVPWAIAISAVVAVPSALWSHFRGARPDWPGLLASLAALFAIPAVMVGLSALPEFMRPYRLLPFVLMGVAPQIAAFALVRRRPLLRPLVAAACAVAGTVLYAIPPALMRITPD